MSEREREREREGEGEGGKYAKIRWKFEKYSRLGDEKERRGNEREMRRQEIRIGGEERRAKETGAGGKGDRMRAVGYMNTNVSGDALLCNAFGATEQGCCCVVISLLNWLSL